MTRSMLQEAELPCPQCDQPIKADIWIVVDVEEHPDLAVHACAGTLHDVVCQHCGAEGSVEAPLLYHDGVTRRLIYAAPSQTTVEQDREIATRLAQHLLSEIEDQTPAYLQKVEIIPGLESLGAALDQPPLVIYESAQPPSAEEAIAAISALMGAESEESFDAVLQQHASVLHSSVDQLIEVLIDEADSNYDAAYAGSLRFIRERLATARVANAHSINMLSAIQKLLDAPSSEAATEIINEHATYLLAPEACDVLTELAKAAEAQGDDELAVQLREVRDALQDLQSGGQDVRNN